MAEIWVRDLVDGDAVDGEFGVVEKSRQSAKNGDQYLQMEVRDSSGAIGVKKWKCQESEWSRIAEAACVRVRGHVQLYNGKLGIIADSVVPGADPNRTEGFLPTYDADPAREWKAFKAHARSVQDPHLSDLLRRVFSARGFLDAFKQATAAQRMHHVGAGGLLAHTVEVADLCMAVCDKAPQLRRDLLLTGALLHDIGKVEEIDCTSVAFPFTVEGGMVGHVVLGASRVQSSMDEMPDFPPNLRAAVIHLILSHQGTREWGAPVLPAIPEAVVLHACDNVSAKMDEFATAKGTAAGNALFGYARGISERVFLGDIELSTGENPAAPFWSLDGDTETGRPVLRIVAGGMSGEETLPEMAAVPILGSIAAGVPIDAQQHVDGYLAVPIGVSSDAGDFLLKVSGESMRDAHILNGDLVRVRPLTGDPRDGDIVAALLNGEVTVKRLQRGANGFVLHPENPDFTDIAISDSDDFQVQGRVVSLIREQVQ